MKACFLALTLLLLPPVAQAQFRIDSDFALHLPATFLDQLILQYSSSFTRKPQSFTLEHTSLSAGDSQVELNGVHGRVNYSLVPQRGTAPYEWKLNSQSVNAQTSVDQILIRQHQTHVIDGVSVGVDVTVECRGLSLLLPVSAGAGAQARISAHAVHGKLQLNLSEYHSQFPAQGWQIQALDCPRIGEIQGQVEAKIVRYLAELSSTDSAAGEYFKLQLAEFARITNADLLSPRAIPSGKEYLTISQNPHELQEDGKGSFSLLGILQFLYATVRSEGEHSLKLPPGSPQFSQASPQLFLPFATLRAMLAGEYMSGKLRFSLASSKIPAFTKLMHSRVAQIFVWPDLLQFHENEIFQFNIAPLAAPDCLHERSAGDGVVGCDITAPMRAQMLAPFRGDWEPYIKFSSNLNGRALFQLDRQSSIRISLTASPQPISYEFSGNYLDRHDPDIRLAIKTITKAAYKSLGTQDISMPFPTLDVNRSMRLVAKKWNLLPARENAERVLSVDLKTLAK